MKILYECQQCGKTFVLRHGDGLNCNKCRGYLKPLGYADELKKEAREMLDKIKNAEPYKKMSKDIKVRINVDADKAMEEIREVAKDIIKKHIKIEF
ncbi:hypothetical protein [Clostridium sporogenes]|uniref:hypothetical protein n=1 Tax=Clostridium sporogenes TaxID=1509 RepID=UPI0006B25D78|nr:hypothetical protein [Clostridium sporogenes]